MLVGGVVVEDDVDHLAGRHLGLDRVQEAHELLMAVALHVAADGGPVEDVERSEQGRGAMALVVVRHRRSNGWSRPADRQASAPPRARPPPDRAEGCARAASCPLQEAVDAFLHEPFLPAPDAGLRLAGPAHDLVGANTVGAREDDRRPPSVFLRGVTVRGDRFKSAADGPRDRDGNSGAHAPDSHGNRNRGIPIRTLLSGEALSAVSFGIPKVTSGIFLTYIFVTSLSDCRPGGGTPVQMGVGA